MKIYEIVKKTDHLVSPDEIYQNLNKGYGISFTNFYSYLKTDNQEFKYLSSVYLDGMAASKCYNLLGYKSKRISMDFTSLADTIFTNSARDNLSIAIIASKQHELESSISFLRQKYTKIKIDFYHHGYIDSQETLEYIVNQLILKNITITIIGMGSPNQEVFIDKIRLKGYTGGCITCGGFIEQISQTGTFYPGLVDRLNLRFAYRIYKKPSLAVRYFLYYPVGIFKFFTDLRR